jgi:hypothetical protein
LEIRTDLLRSARSSSCKEQTAANFKCGERGTVRSKGSTSKGAEKESGTGKGKGKKKRKRVRKTKSKKKGTK